VYHLQPGRHEIVERAERADRLYFSPRSEIDAAVRQRLTSLLKHAAATVPYYRALIESQEISEDTALDVLQRLPVLTKDIIRAQGNRLTSESPGTRIRVNTSGGSTGEPIQLLQDAEMDRKSRSYELLFMKWARHRPGEPHVLIWGVPEEAFGRPILWRERAFRFVHNETYLNCYRITDTLLDEWVRKINAIRPTLIEAYVDALHELSVRVLKTGASIASPRGIVTSAGVLTPAMAEIIRRAFRAPIINRYGSREVSNVACSCGLSQELHVNEAWSYLEVVDEKGQACPPGVEGDILVTLFGNRTMPLIRYRIEDRGVWASGECPCGRRTRRLAAVSGRRTDYLVTADGTRINGVAIATYTALAALHDAKSGVRQFQYRQRRPGHVTLAIVPREGVGRDSLRSNVQTAVSSLGHMFQGVTVDVEIEREILPSNSGKLRYVVNELQGD
jgi:phenylacetate-CoA ligase